MNFIVYIYITENILYISLNIYKNAVYVNK